MKRTDKERRRFLVVGSSGLASLLVGCPSRTEHGSSVRDTQQTNGAGKVSAEGQGAHFPRRTDSDDGGPGETFDSEPHQTEGCSPTSRDITGPYWREGIPIRSNFDLYGHAGTRLTISGIVKDAQCRPIKNAVVEMWHAHPTANEPSELSRSDGVDYDMKTSECRYYGQFSTSEDGHYVVITKKPGWYLNGPTFRPSHIHVRIYVADVERLTTQLYFHGDPFIEKDPWASVAPERVVKLTRNIQNHARGKIDFVLS